MTIPKNVKRLFWDVSVKNSDLKTSRNFVITRIAEKGGMADLRWLVKSFGKPEVKRVVAKSRNVSAKTKNFWRIIK